MCVCLYMKDMCVYIYICAILFLERKVYSIFSPGFTSLISLCVNSAIWFDRLFLAALVKSCHIYTHHKLSSPGMCHPWAMITFPPEDFRLRQIIKGYVTLFCVHEITLINWKGFYFFIFLFFAELCLAFKQLKSKHSLILYVRVLSTCSASRPSSAGKLGECVARNSTP